MFLRICALGFSAFLAYDLVRFPLIPRLAHSLGAGPQAIGLAVAASTITGIVGKWLSGGCSDHWGRRRLLLIGSAVCAVMPLTYLCVRNYQTLILLRFLHGSATAILAPVTRAVVSDLAAPQERGATLGTFASAVQIGMSAGRWLGGLLLFWGGFQYPLIAAALAGALACGIAGTWPATERPAAVHPWPDVLRAVVDEARAITRSRLTMATGVVEASQFLVCGAVEAFLPIYAVEVAGLNDSHVGMLFGLQLLTLVVTKPLIGWWSDRLPAPPPLPAPNAVRQVGARQAGIGRVPLIGAGLLVCSALVWMIPRTTTLLGLSLLLIGYSVGAATASASTLALITDLAADDAHETVAARYGASHGLFGTLVDVGHASGPLVGGVLIAHLQYRGAFLILAGLLAVVTGLFVVTARVGPHA